EGERRISIARDEEGEEADEEKAADRASEREGEEEREVPAVDRAQDVEVDAEEAKDERTAQARENHRRDADGARDREARRLVDAGRGGGRPARRDGLVGSSRRIA